MAPLLGAGCAARHPDWPGPIDAHTHFYDPRRPEGIPWPPKDDTLLYRPVLPDEFLRLAEPLGIRRTIVVEASPRIADNDWVLDLATGNPALIGLVGHLKPGRDGYAEALARYARRPGFRGIRTGLWNVEVAPEDRAISNDLRLLADRGLALDVLVGPDQLDRVARLARSLPELRIVVDHCANVRIDGSEPPRVWMEGLDACARCPRVFFKVSGLVEGTGRTDGTAPADTAYYAKVLDAIWDRLGDRRVLFGSNWPVSARFAPYDRVYGIVADYAAHRGEESARRYFATNAVAAYGLDRREL